MRMEKLTINDKEVLIKKIPLRVYPQLIGIIREIQAKTKGIITKDSSTDDIIAALPELITQCYPEVVQILHVGLGVPKEDIEEWGIDELIDVITKLFDVCRFQYIYETIKKTMASPQAGKMTTRTPEAQEAQPSETPTS